MDEKRSVLTTTRPVELRVEGTSQQGGMKIKRGFQEKCPQCGSGGGKGSEACQDLQAVAQGETYSFTDHQE